MGMLEGAAILLAGILVGRFLPSRRRRKEPKPIEPVCGCGHQYAFHDPGTGRCGGRVEVNRWSGKGRWAGLDREQCPCQRYTGPEPLPEYYAPEITP